MAYAPSTTRFCFTWVNAHCEAYGFQLQDQKGKDGRLAAALPVALFALRGICFWHYSGWDFLQGFIAIGSREAAHESREWQCDLACEG